MHAPLPHTYVHTKIQQIQVINNPNGTCQEANADFICLTDLESYTRDANLLNSIPDHTFQLRFTTPMINNDILFNNDNNKHYSFFSKYTYTGQEEPENRQIMSFLLFIYFTTSP